MHFVAAALGDVNAKEPCKGACASGILSMFEINSLARNHYVSKMLSLLCRKGFSAKPRLGISADAGLRSSCLRRRFADLTCTSGFYLVVILRLGLACQLGSRLHGHVYQPTPFN